MILIRDIELRKILCNHHNCSDQNDNQYPICELLKEGKCRAYSLFDKIKSKSLDTGDIAILYHDKGMQ